MMMIPVNRLGREKSGGKNNESQTESHLRLAP
jgi:hypothetical protein